MHSRIRNDDKRGRKHSQADDIAPQRKGVKAKGAQDRSAGDLDVEAVLVVDEREVGHFVDDEGLEAIVEYGELERK